ncbi:helix-turn-helix domain-containing protein [Streptomyces sp. NBC_00385]|uniref:helix-turn-helix domain-containing protein n=1 Tax=Streptomyces sp. NBC_00385 TaxID=2975733 RepID=UPI002DD9A971|nr:helix-turn-helix domain-containing protein [Streptomyces sp. NBC_00385]WRZ03604.1 helix-turn-helix domain-containing protein [Streptomyces sp. NBC_00385]WRZ06922.1 helix-turn-helix domain-containing protein [Streptomyces sp. NBC_00385]
MNNKAITVYPGVRLLYCGDVVEVMELDGLQVTLRNERTGDFSALALGRLASQARALEEERGAGAEDAGLLMAALTPQQRKDLRERAEHVREVLSGYRAGHAGSALAGEPRPGFAPGTTTLQQRSAAKAAELRVTPRTVDRWLAAYRESGEAGLVDARALKGRGSRVDPRWEMAVRAVLAELVDASTPSRSAVLDRAKERLEGDYGADVVPAPPRSTAYRRLAELTKGTNAVSGSAKARRSIAGRPQGTYGRLRATRPGEYVVLDTQDLDIYAMESVTCRWVPVQLTVAQDLFSRCIVGLRVTACSTKAVDVAGVLFEAVCPPLENAARSELAPYHGVPDEVVFAEEVRPGGGLCPPETLVIDHGKAFMSAHVISVCTRLGMSIQPAQPKKPTDKPTVERFFRTLREGLVQHLPAYKGPDVHSRGEGIEDQAFFYLHEVEEVVREWIAEVYHRRQHDGLVVPQWPHLELSPVEMLRVGLQRAGRLRMLPSAELAFEFLAVKPRTVQHYGVEVDGLRYNGEALDGYRNAPSPYGGAFAGRWPIRVNPDDVRFVYFQDPADDQWHALEWEHAAALNMAFSAEAATYARRLAARQGRHIDAAQALSDLLARWDTGMVTDRRERRMAVRLSAERTALALPALPEQRDALTAPDLRVVPDPPAGDCDEEDEIFDAPEADDFYADAFEVIE